MNEQTTASFEGADEYHTPKSFLCDLCCNLVVKGRPAVAVMYSHVEKNPIYILPGEDDDIKSFTFVRLCPECGEDHV